jgi:hypothetical protein
MVSRAQLDRLSSRIEALAVHNAAGIAVIFMARGETESAAMERHYLARPQDREASHTVVVQYVAAKNGRRLELGDGQLSGSDDEVHRGMSA